MKKIGLVLLVCVPLLLLAFAFSGFFSLVGVVYTNKWWLLGFFLALLVCGKILEELFHHLFARIYQRASGIKLWLIFFAENYLAILITDLLFVHVSFGWGEAIVVGGLLAVLEYSLRNE